MKWVTSGEKWMWTTWVSDAQVTYLLEPWEGGWMVHKKVHGAADPTGYRLGWRDDLRGAKNLAESDSEKPL